MSKWRWDLWAQGLASAVITGATTGVTLVIADPNAFMIEPGGLKKLGIACLVQALLGAALYLRVHPTPVEDDVVAPRP